jgi:hypothetical protein
VAITGRWSGRDDAEEIAAALASWTGPVWTGQLQPGDIGWQLRFEADELNATLLLVRENGRAAAVALVDAPGELRVAVDPRRQDDVRLAAGLVDELLAAPRTVPTSLDGSPVAAWRHRLAELGWSTGDASFVAMHRSLQDVGPELPDGVRPVADEDDIADRVLVQRQAFERSTFTVDRWRLMAGTSMYDGTLDLLARDGEGGRWPRAPRGRPGPGVPASSSPSAPTATTKVSGTAAGSCSGCARRWRQPERPRPPWRHLSRTSPLSGPTRGRDSGRSPCSRRCTRRRRPTEVAASREQDLDLGEHVVGAAPREGDAGATVAVAVHDAAR